ncbi:MAG: hypothetical protein WBE46_09125 [Dehalococcoidia bacterium]
MAISIAPTEIASALLCLAMTERRCHYERSVASPILNSPTEIASALLCLTMTTEEGASQ